MGFVHFLVVLSVLQVCRANIYFLRRGIGKALKCAPELVHVRLHALFVHHVVAAYLYVLLQWHHHSFRRRRHLIKTAHTNFGIPMDFLT